MIEQEDVILKRMELRKINRITTHSEFVHQKIEHLFNFNEYFKITYFSKYRIDTYISVYICGIFKV